MNIHRPTLHEFIDTSFAAPLRRNVWLKHPDLSLYVRSSKRVIDNELCTTFEIANIAIKLERKLGQGHFTKFLDNLEITLIGTRYQVLYIENVFEERFQKFFIRKGFKEMELPFPDPHETTRSYHKVINK